MIKEGGDNDGAENKDHEEKIDIKDEVGEFLMTIPPNWEKAENHAKANLTLKADETVLELDKKDTYCMCCHMPYPKDSDYYELCCPNEELGIIGAGYPLLFEFMKYIAILMFILTIIYFLPYAAMIYNILKTQKIDKKNNPIALFSYGVFIQNYAENIKSGV